MRRRASPGTRVREGLGGRDGDRVTRVHAHRVEVLDRADDDAVVRVVAHDLELELLPTGDRALDEDLVDRDLPRGPRRPCLHELVAVLRDAGAGPPEDEARADHDREADRVADRDGLVDESREARRRHREADLGHRQLEQLAVLGRRMASALRADELDAEVVETSPTRRAPSRG